MGEVVKTEKSESFQNQYESNANKKVKGSKFQKTEKDKSSQSNARTTIEDRGSIPSKNSEEKKIEKMIATNHNVKSSNPPPAPTEIKKMNEKKNQRQEKAVMLKKESQLSNSEESKNGKRDKNKEPKFENKEKKQNPNSFVSHAQVKNEQKPLTPKENNDRLKGKDGKGDTKNLNANKDSSVADISLKKLNVSSNRQNKRNEGIFRQSVNIPQEIYSWCCTENEDVENIRIQTLEKSGASSISFVEERRGRANFLIEAKDHESAKRASLLLETHLQNQVRVRRLTERKSELASYLQATQDEIDKGLRVQFPVEQDLLGLTIGSGGANIKFVQEKVNVDSIFIDKKELMVRIVGKDPEEVKRARDLLEFKTSIIPISKSAINILINGKSNTLREIQYQSKVVNIFFDGSDDNKHIKIIGLKNSVETAELILQTHLDYIKDLDEIHSAERDMERELRKIDDAYGYGSRPRYDRNNLKTERPQDKKQSHVNPEEKRPERSEPKTEIPTEKRHQKSNQTYSNDKPGRKWGKSDKQNYNENNSRGPTLRQSMKG